ncbi:hypothetical protein D3C74_475580 [compost metagenome]
MDNHELKLYSDTSDRKVILLSLFKCNRSVRSTYIDQINGGMALYGPDAPDGATRYRAEPA